MTGVSPFRGFIRSAVRANGINACKNHEIQFSFETHVAKLPRGWRTIINKMPKFKVQIKSKYGKCPASPALWAGSFTFFLFS
jgi:hypothetical protein